jgi:hypothetical protein
MKIAILIEGKTERAFMPALRRFLKGRLAGRMPNLDPMLYDGRIPTGDRLKRDVERLLREPRAADAGTAIKNPVTPPGSSETMTCSFQPKNARS